jgi:hypothetical protein
VKKFVALGAMLNTAAAALVVLMPEGQRRECLTAVKSWKGRSQNRVAHQHSTRPKCGQNFPRRTGAHNSRG